MLLGLVRIRQLAIFQLPYWTATRQFISSSRSIIPMGAIGTQTVVTTARVTALRELMAKKEHNVDVFVVPSEDQHSSEYLAECDARRAFISGFNGSAGCAIITRKEALLFTDGRYFLQASQQLDSNWTLMKQGLPDVPTWQEYLTQLEKNSRIGVDPTLISAVDANAFKESLGPSGSRLVPLSKNLVDEVWGASRPLRPKNTVFPLDLKYSGVAGKDKIATLRQTLTEKKATGIVVSMLDEVAWLFNLRGSDIEFNPVFFAYALVTHSNATLYIDDAQIIDVVRAHLGSEVIIKAYEAVWEDLKLLGASLKDKEQDKILLGTKTSLAIANALGEENVILTRSPIADAKSLKNDTELEGFRQCHIRDGAALVKYFAWLEEELNKGSSISESQAAAKLKEYRSTLPLFKGLSFETISSTGPNGAIIHYSPDPKNSATIKKDQMYLCDSGAQFLDGTTDVTRTWHFGTPTTEECRVFTRVLQGHIAIDTAVFPQGTSGYILDSFARRALWQDGLDYRHGTGHGVGHFLNVHEGPQGIGTRIAYNETHLKAGMTLSNEPGYYADGKFGIRIENIVLVRDVQTPNNFGGRGYLGFEHVTMCPIHRKLIELELLTPDERRWVNEYHVEVRGKVAPLLQDDERALKWLERETQSL
ncbi:Creatinase/aminopeptidase [Ramaria rubella]|nr:Creatinase/aminopeptidase [Ramaria rubella]